MQLFVNILLICTLNVFGFKESESTGCTVLAVESANYFSFLTGSVSETKNTVWFTGKIEHPTKCNKKLLQKRFQAVFNSTLSIANLAKYAAIALNLKSSVNSSIFTGANLLRAPPTALAIL